jgi:hypothetical protein
MRPLDGQRWLIPGEPPTCYCTKCTRRRKRKKLLAKEIGDLCFRESERERERERER